MIFDNKGKRVWINMDIETDESSCYKLYHIEDGKTLIERYSDFDEAVTRVKAIQEEYGKDKEITAD